MKMNNDNFVWTDELVKEFIDFGRRMMVISDIDSIGMNIDKFKQSKSIPNKEDKKPILTTEDGVDIFENDRVWFVDRLFNIDQYDFIDMGDKTEDLKHYPELYKYFSTEEKAKEYIIENKPCLSLNDVMNIFRNHFEKFNDMHPSHGTIKTYLLDLVKQKLNS